MRTKFTLPDGGRALAVHVMTRANNDSFRWKSVSRVIDGTLHPDIDEVTFIRKTTESSAPPNEATKTGSSSQDKGETKAMNTFTKIAVLTGSALLVSFTSPTSLAPTPRRGCSAVSGSCPTGCGQERQP